MNKTLWREILFIIIVVNGTHKSKLFGGENKAIGFG
jgi:hypothetical protein